jgi:prepilin-type N-terminal cleavage/methylation domain-containing protein
VAFTLIELLTVIAIIAIVATMVVTMGQAAAQKKKIVAVEGIKRKLILMIGSYQAKLNYYPPDNGFLASVNYSTSPSNYDAYAAKNPLLYELTGATNLNNGETLAVFNTNNLSAVAYSNVFNRAGVANGDALEPHNFFKPSPAPKEYAAYAVSGGVPICGLIAPTDLTPGNTNNFWRYDSSSTNRHNLGSYDLWAEFYVGSKNGKLTMITNGNW